MRLACILQVRQLVAVKAEQVAQEGSHAKQLSENPIYPTLHTQVLGAAPESEAFGLHPVQFDVPAALQVKQVELQIPHEGSEGLG